MPRRNLALLAASLSILVQAGPAGAEITFPKGWDSPENSNVQAYTQDGATTFLQNASDELKTMIDKPSCHLEVTKGCHQPNDRHFTANGLKSSKSCKSIYAGSKSIHIPC